MVCGTRLMRRSCGSGAAYLWRTTPPTRRCVIGISCHVNDYRLCWSLNRSIGIALSRRERDIQDEGDASYAAFDDDADPKTKIVATIGPAEFVLAFP
jgi:hypothetical protein